MSTAIVGAAVAAGAASASVVAAWLRPPGRVPAVPRSTGTGRLDGRLRPPSALGAALRRRCGLPPDGAADVVATVAVAVVPLVAMVVPPAAAAVPVLWWGWETARRRSVAAGRRRTVVDELPDVVDLLRLGVGAGLSLPLALPVVARQRTGPVSDALGAAHGDARAGRSLSSALEAALGATGGGAVELAHVLADHLRYGTALEPALHRLGSEARAHRRREAEAAARRVPVRLLLPLVLCVLPAFGLLTVVPLLAGSLQSLLR